MNIRVKIESNFAEGPSGIAEGQYETRNGFTEFCWIQPASEGEAFGAKYTITYDTFNKILEMVRSGDYISVMRFCEGTRTRGELSTPGGRFELEIFTRELLVPDKPAGCAVLRYDLILPGQEPMENELFIHFYPSEIQ
jgi:uncharacterized beta-barrel protein YwiB (DUF1934 family)